MAFALDGKLRLDARDFVAGTKQAKQGVEDVGDEFGKLPKEAKSSAKGVEGEFGKLPGAGGKIGDKFGGNLGKGMVAGFGAIGVGGLIMKGISQAMDAQAGEQLLQGQFDLTAQEAERYGDLAGELYAEGWGEGLQEVQGAVATVSQRLGIETETELAKISEGVLAVSKTWGEDFDAVVRSTGQLLQNDLAPNAEAALDLVVAAFQDGGNEAGDLLDTIDEYAQHWSEMGLSGEDALAMIVHGFQNGQRDADKMADAMKQMNIEITSNAEPVRAALEDIGLNADDVVAAFKEGGPAAREAFLKVVTALKEGQERGEDTTNAVAILGTQFEDLGVQGLDSMLAIEGGIDGLEGSMTDLGGMMEATDWVKFQRRAEQALTPIGEAALYVGNDMLAGLERVGDWGDGFGELIGISKNWESQTTDDIGSVNAFMADFDATMLDGLSTFDQVHAKIMAQASAVLSDKDALRAANEMTNTWAKENEKSAVALKAHGNALGTTEWELDQLRGQTENATAANEDNEASAEDLEAALDAEQAALDRVTEAFGRMSDELSDRSAYLDVQDGFAEMREAMGTTEGVSERMTIALQQDVLDYVTELDNIPPETVAEILTQVEQGQLDAAWETINAFETTRTTRINIDTYYRTIGSQGAPTVQPDQGGPRAAGGPVRAGAIYEVNELGPELLQTGGRTFLMSSAPGHVVPLSPVTHNRQVSNRAAVNVQVYAGIGTDGTQVGAQITDALEDFYRSGGQPAVPA